MTKNIRQTVKDPGVDILSHSKRRNSVHILTLDKALADDVSERIRTDVRMEGYTVKRPIEDLRHAVEEIEAMAPETVTSRLIVIDVRKSTLPILQPAYNKVVGYNRRNLNSLCYIVLIGDGPMNLFQPGRNLDEFVPYLTKLRLDYYPAVFFYDPFLHYEPDELVRTDVDLAALIPTKLPKRLAYYFKEQAATVNDIRKFFRAAGKPQQAKQKRLKKLRDLYAKRSDVQFPNDQKNIEALFTRQGVQLATEQLHLYPLFFEDWAFDLIQKAREASS
jgi:hypothetical protein